MKKLFLIAWIFALALLTLWGCGSSDEDDPSTTSGQASEDDDDNADDDDAVDDDDDDNDDEDDDDDDDDNTVEECWNDLAVGAKEILANGFSGTEGIAFGAGGELFVSAKSNIVRINPDGTWTSVAGGLINAVGIAIDPAGDLFICEFGDSSAAGVNDGSIYKMDSTFSINQLVDGIPNPNFITYTPQGNFIVSDGDANGIFQVTTAGGLSTWLSDIESPNGMVYSPDRSSLYVAGTFAPGAPLYEVSLDAQGAPVSFETIANLDTASLPDGVALDEEGMIYVAENLLGKVVKVDPDSGTYEAVADGMITPASMAFGKGPDFDPCSIYVTELLGPRVWRIALGVHGYPLADE